MPRRCELEQLLRDARVRAGEPARRSREEAILVCKQVDGHGIDREQLGHALERGVECVRERELGGRLADDRKERSRTVELEREERARSLARNAWAARTPNVASRLSCSASGAVPGAKRSWRIPATGWPSGSDVDTVQPPGRRSDSTMCSGPRSPRACRASSRAGPSSASAASPKEPLSKRPPGACSQISPAAAPATLAATRTISEAESPSPSAAASASPASSSVEGERASAGRAPPANTRRTSAAWPAASSAANRSVAVNAAPAR